MHLALKDAPLLRSQDHRDLPPGVGDEEADLDRGSHRGDAPERAILIVLN